MNARVVDPKHDLSCHSAEPSLETSHESVRSHSQVDKSLMKSTIMFVAYRAVLKLIRFLIYSIMRN